jgi:hypothetical protein
LERRTLAIFRKAEFGFFGVIVVTLTQTPLLNGDDNLVRVRVCGLKSDPSAGVFDRCLLLLRPRRVNWLIVGIVKSYKLRIENKLIIKRTRCQKTQDQNRDKGPKNKWDKKDITGINK